MAKLLCRQVCHTLRAPSGGALSQILFRETFYIFRGHKTGIFTFSSYLARKCLSIWPGIVLFNRQPEANSGISVSSSQTLFLCICVRIFFLQFY